MVDYASHGQAFNRARGIALDAHDMKHRLVAIGTSAEGVIELRRLIETLSATLNAAIVVVVRTDANESHLLNVVGPRTPLPVDYAQPTEPIVPGRIYVAPPDRHMLVQGDHIRLIHGPRENGARPAIDPLFRSAAFAYGTRAIGIVLSGSLDDGTAGLLAIKDRGGIAVVQDPADAIAPSMPGSAIGPRRGRPLSPHRGDRAAHCGAYSRYRDRTGRDRTGSPARELDAHHRAGTLHFRCWCCADRSRLVE